MANYVNADMTFTDICSAILQEYKEPITGSNAVPLDYVEDMVNVVYFDVFNRPQLRAYNKEGDHPFAIKANQKLGEDVTVGEAAIDLDDSSLWPATGRFCVNNQDFIDFTANDLVLTLTCTTGTVKLTHSSGETCELAYSLPSDIDNQKAIGLAVGGTPYSFKRPDLYFNDYEPTYNNFTILESYLYVSSGVAANCLMTYYKKITALSATTDKPAFILGNWRYDLLVSGTIERIGIRDDMRTGWDWHSANYKEKLKMFIAELNNPVRSNTSRRPTVWD